MLLVHLIAFHMVCLATPSGALSPTRRAWRGLHSRRNSSSFPGFYTAGLPDLSLASVKFHLHDLVGDHPS